MPKNDLPAVVEKKDAFSRILRFLTLSDVTLNGAEEKILDRWIYCDAMMRQGVKTREEMVDDIKEKWGVSRFTAENDINQTQRLFERSRKASKKYLGHIHLERINQDIQRFRAVIFGTYEDEKGKMQQRCPCEKELTALSRMEDSYTKALDALPDEDVADKQPPPIFNFNMAPGQQLEGVLSPEEAIKAADTILMKENGEGVYEMDAE